MKIIVATDSFKGSLTSVQAATAIEKGILRAARSHKKGVEIEKIPMADGGEGTVEAVISSSGGHLVSTKVLDPLGREIDSFFGILPDKTAVIEMAAASGLDLIKSEERDPMQATSYGTGQLIKAAMDEGCQKIILGIGGSATNDGGVGMAQALGIRFLDDQGDPIGFGGGQLGKISKIDTSSLDPRCKETNIKVASDVENVLTGPEGASAIFGPQKGASQEDVQVLDKNLTHLAEMLYKVTGQDIGNIPGTGAAGGMGACLIPFLNATFNVGIELVMGLTSFEERIADAHMIVTGEGATDHQTLFGKVPFGIAQVAKRHEKPVICISGSLGKDYEKLYQAGIAALFSIVNRPMTLETAMDQAQDLLEKGTEDIFNLYFTSMG